MSGTSADGIDAALCRLSGTGETLRAELLAFRCYPFDPSFRRDLLALFTPDAPVGEVCTMNVLLGRKFAEAALDLIREAGVGEVDLIASHGQTICHLPEAGATLQIGEPAVIAELTGTLVAADFRPRDMAAGGQGAPLVPYADWVLFRDPEKTRAIQNLGGIANVTVLPAAGGLDRLLAFDTGPGNMVIDGLASALSGNRLAYDHDGAWAAQGKMDEGLLSELTHHPFLSRRPPKSTGREEFGAPFVTELLERGRGMAAEDLLATATAFTAESIAAAYRDFVLPAFPLDEVILGGGGSYNLTLRKMLEERLPGIAVRLHEDFGINGEAKEALAFAILGNETVLGRPANVPSATGARHSVVLGEIVLP
jgi:anhydro-N-acetylmuramic acid kinase